MSNEIKVLEQFFDAINCNDIQAVIKDFNSQIVRIEPEGFPTLALIVVLQKCKNMLEKDVELGLKEPASLKSF